MEIEYTLKAKEDLDYWKNSKNANVLKKIRTLVESIGDTPYEGIGKPEALKYGLSGCWSRRINREHRLVYEVFEDKTFILSLRGHY